MLIPAPDATTLEVRFASLEDRDQFNPPRWQRAALAPGTQPGWWEFRPETLGLPDGAYEYEFLVNGSPDPVADPYATEITRFGGYRGIFRLKVGKLQVQTFRWDDELPSGVRLPQNNEMVVYEMPLHWMSNGGGDTRDRQVGLGTFDEVIFERLDELQALGVNCIELLPVQDSPDTLNWGYGTRFFFAPDIDMGGPVDAKLFIKRCHQRGIRVILDVVMNHARECPLERLAFDWFFLRDDAAEFKRRNSWGGRLFSYATPAPDGTLLAPEFHVRMAKYWIDEYHIDGFRIDEFKGIDNWDFLQDFRDKAWSAHQARFPGRPFIVIGEDSNRRALATQDDSQNRNGRKVVDAIWGFHYRDEIRRLMEDQITTQWLQPPRRDRIRALVSGTAMFESLDNSFRRGFTDLAQVVNYATSHDVADGCRLMNLLFGDTLRFRGLGDASFETVRQIVDNLAGSSQEVQAAHADAVDWVRSAFALLLTSVGIPMFLAGEEFADVHDLKFYADAKMSDPVNWERAKQPPRQTLRNAVGQLIRLRTGHRALQRNEVDFFWFHPEIDQNNGARVFAYCRTAGRQTGQAGQVAVIVNAGGQRYPSFDLPWPWAANGGTPTEHGAPAAGDAIQVLSGTSTARLSLGSFQARVFAV